MVYLVVPNFFMVKENKNLDAEIIIKFKVKDVIDERALEENYEGRFSDCMEELIKEEGILGIAEDNYEILSIIRINQ